MDNFTELLVNHEYKPAQTDMLSTIKNSKFLALLQVSGSVSYKLNMTEYKHEVTNGNPVGKLLQKDRKDAGDTHSL